jgi:hypothetical protein
MNDTSRVICTASIVIIAPKKTQNTMSAAES